MAKTLQLRRLRRGEQRVLAAKLKDLSLSARVHQRYRVIEEVRRGHSVVAAADRVGCHFTVAYDWVHRFNESGFATFEQVPNPKGRPPILRGEQLRELVEVALSSPPGARAAVLKLVRAEAGRVLPRQAAAAAGDRRVGAPAVAPRGPERPAHPHLEALA
ncbi:MAG: helix-turn-helix domain-containing protein [Burkholderiales bacterium]|nr:helix-turn-helix domain-containing protein [Burkholderiales bacterium]